MPAGQRAGSNAAGMLLGGPASRIPQPEIPLTWPLSAAATDTHACVADPINRRVVKVRPDYEEERTVRVG